MIDRITPLYGACFANSSELDDARSTKLCNARLQCCDGSRNTLEGIPRTNHRAANVELSCTIYGTSWFWPEDRVSCGLMVIYFYWPTATSLDMITRSSVLGMHSRARMLYHKSWNFPNGKEINTDDLPDGGFVR